MIVEKGKIISIFYSIKLVQNGKLIASRLKKPLRFRVGDKKLILGMDKELLGLKAGDKKKVRITPENGYGFRNEKLVKSLKRSQISDNVNVREGVILKKKAKSGRLFKGRIKSFDDQNVIIDFNHPLAGETFNLEMQVIDIRNAPPKKSAQ